jgi:hypothetical protein
MMTDSDVHDTALADSTPEREPESTGDGSEPQQPQPRKLPTAVAVVFADLGIAFVALIALVVIGLQRWDDTAPGPQRRAYFEGLAVIFLVAAVFTVLAVALMRSGRVRVAGMQIVITVAILALGTYAAVQGRPSANPTITTPPEPTDSPTVSLLP